MYIHGIIFYNSTVSFKDALHIRVDILREEIMGKTKLQIDLTNKESEWRVMFDQN